MATHTLSLPAPGAEVWQQVCETYALSLADVSALNDGDPADAELDFFCHVHRMPSINLWPLPHPTPQGSSTSWKSFAPRLAAA